jgi:hypothetical protein
MMMQSRRKARGQPAPSRDPEVQEQRASVRDLFTPVPVRCERERAR